MFNVPSNVASTPSSYNTSMIVTHLTPILCYGILNFRFRWKLNNHRWRFKTFQLNQLREQLWHPSHDSTIPDKWDSLTSKTSYTRHLFQQVLSLRTFKLMLLPVASHKPHPEELAAKWRLWAPPFPSTFQFLLSTCTFDSHQAKYTNVQKF